MNVSFDVFHFSKAKDSENNVLVTETSNSEEVRLKNFTFSTENTVYLCPEDTSLMKINPRCPRKIIL